ncbi:Kunitz family trypsin and protease inhibitor protein [Hibiscus syriacus]|uniref:Kunitz family trypsin and protease inhibitor protein n=1 Tax=Hibiscus syriacus TaxID=106335 RepID=A0A6A3BVK8_HIBSY|nr:Kunitz family trypsin and protease inhibitor protein [Hibiscus syriacus]
MNDLHLISSASINSFMVDGRKMQKGPRPAITYPAKSFRSRSFSGSNVQYRFHNKAFANKGTKFNEVSNNFSYNSFITCYDSSAVISKEFNATNPSAMFINSSEEDKSKKRNSQKRAKKKGKHKKKQSCDVGFTESEVYSQYTHGNSSSVAVTSSGSPNISTSDIDEVDISEFVVPSEVQKFPREHHINKSEMGCEDYQLSRCQGDKEGKHLSHMGSLEDLQPKDFSDVHDSLDSVSVGSNYEDSTNAVILKPFNKNILDQFLHGLADSCLHGRNVASSKRDKQFKSVPVSSGSCRPGNIGNHNSRSGTENSHFVWQRIQKKAVEKCNSELKKTSPFSSEFDVSLKDVPALKRNTNAVNATTLSITNDKKSKSKVPRKLKRKVSPASKEKNSFSWKESHPNKVDYPRVGTMKSESVDNFQAGPSGIEPCDTVCDTVCGTVFGLNNICIENQNNILQKSFVPLDRPNLFEVQSPVYLSHLMVNGVAQTEKGISLAENDLPICLRSIPMSQMLKPGFPKIPLKRVNPCSENLSSITFGTLCRTGKDLRHEISSIEKQDLSAAATDLNKITKALNDAYRAQMASEAVQMVTGCPIAEFERLLHFCSPAICHSYSSVGCQTCLLDQGPSALLCRHETPNIPLGCLWKWYEKHGSYGLEIRAEDHKNPERLGIDQSAFHAYFVPYLSAVQLFRNSTNNSTQNNTRISYPGISGDSDTCSISRNSATVGHRSIFSVLVPQPCTAEPSNQLQVNDVVRSEPSSVCPEDVLPVKSVDITRSVCLELAFEYFESEQPQQRRTLYENKQTLNGGATGEDAGYKTWLEMMYLLGAKSFLTYHSLGHLVRRSSKFDDYPSVDACVVSPVVGLQSCNAQGECWFQPRHSTTNDTCENQGLSLSGMLKERLRTLKETTSLMARAVVTKGNKTPVNRHPDYEFFFSRQQ